jgi:hypothetical protein
MEDLCRDSLRMASEMILSEVKSADSLYPQLELKAFLLERSQPLC